MELTLFNIVIACLGFFAVFVLKGMDAKLGKAADSVENLNVKIAVVIERLEKHDEQLEKLTEKTDKTHNDLIEMKARVEK